MFISKNKTEKKNKKEKEKVSAFYASLGAAHDRKLHRRELFAPASRRGGK
jgi:hypothetical protein